MGKYGFTLETVVVVGLLLFVQAIASVLGMPFTISRLSQYIGLFGYSGVIFLSDLPCGFFATYVTNKVLARTGMESYYSHTTLSSMVESGRVISWDRVLALKPEKFIRADMPTTWSMKAMGGCLFVVSQLAFAITVWLLIMAMLQL